MDAWTREEKRREVSQRRVRPLKPQRIYFPESGLGECVEVEPDKPLELCIEATDAEGQLVPWLADEWWIRTHSFCKDRLVTIVILPTPNALLDSVVLHQLEMVRRIAPHWHIVGYALSSDAQAHQAAEPWVNSPYDEIRFCEDEIDGGNGVVESVRSLLVRAAEVPRVKGYHQTYVRIMHSMSHRFGNGGLSGSSAEDSATARPQIDRMVEAGVVEST